MDEHTERLLRQRASEADKDTVINALIAFTHITSKRLDPNSEELKMLYDSLGKDGRGLLALCMLAVILDIGRR